MPHVGITTEEKITNFLNSLFNLLDSSEKVVYLIFKLSPQHSVFEYPQFRFLNQNDRPNFISAQNTRYR